MKKPIFKYEDRTNWISPELEIAKMKFRREFDRSKFGKILDKIINWITTK